MASVTLVLLIPVLVYTPPPCAGAQTAEGGRVLSDVLEGVGSHLEASIPAIRTQGMRVAEAFAKVRRQHRFWSMSLVRWCGPCEVALWMGAVNCDCEGS